MKKIFLVLLILSSLLVGGCTNEIELPEETTTTEFTLQPECYTDYDCFVGGCSNQVCSNNPGIITTCEWREEYGCYQKYGQCGCAKGKCQWKDTEELKNCLEELK